MIEEKNKLMNLTGFSGERLWEEGIYESVISLFSIWKNNKPVSLLDIGAGAGFPSVPFLIVFPQTKLTIIEPQKKRATFLNDVSEKLSLNIEIITKRAEEVQDLTFDLITARAVAPLYALLEISTRLGKIGSEFAFLKGVSVEEEVNNAQQIIKKLKIENFEIRKISDELARHNLSIFYYKKQSETPSGLPREWQKIIKQ